MYTSYIMQQITDFQYLTLVVLISLMLTSSLLPVVITKVNNKRDYNTPHTTIMTGLFCFSHVHELFYTYSPFIRYQSL